MRASGSGASEWSDSIEQLSGGQKTLLGLAFVFAVAQYRQAPIYLMDEVDAALGAVSCLFAPSC